MVSSIPKLKESTLQESGERLNVISNANGFVLLAVSIVDGALLFGVGFGLGLYCSVIVQN